MMAAVQAVPHVGNDLSGYFRHLTEIPKAMRLALLWPEPEKGGRGKVSRIGESLGVGKGRAQNLLSQARAVLAYSRELAGTRKGRTGKNSPETGRFLRC